MKQRYRIDISYDGTNYCGWQIQPNALSIQESIQKALKLYFREEIFIVGAGRTDAGVHALQQVAHFDFDGEVDIFKAMNALNGILPYDIRIFKMQAVESDFHARFSAKGKTYYYSLCFNRVHSPFRRLYTSHIRKKVDLSLLEKAAECFVGEHDFSAFANENDAGSAAKNPVRTIDSITIVEEEPGTLRLEFVGQSFLYKMVRNIVGTLLEVIEGKRDLAEIPQIIESKDRRRAGRAAKAHGLTLAEVRY